MIVRDRVAAADRRARVSSSGAGARPGGVELELTAARWLAGRGRRAPDALFVLVFNFFLFRVMATRHAAARLPRATPQEIQQLRALYGLDKPARAVRDYVGDTCAATSGSASDARPVLDELGRAPWTLLLVGTGTLLATMIGSWLGVIAATPGGAPPTGRLAARLQPVHLRAPSTGSGSS
jgi:hypothetical protein